MAQHDYVIDNQLAPAFRSDLNSALAAIVSQNSGVTAPTTTYANMLWYDTTNDLLKMRNESNSGWITLGTVDQTNNVFNPNFLPATQAEAEAGTNNVKGMTALRVAQAVAVLSPAASVNIQVFTATGTYTPTSGYKYGIAFVTGGGAGGSGAAPNTAAAGGCAGGTAIGVLNLTSLGAVTATVGAFGAGGAAGSSGATGGSSTLSTLTGTGGSVSSGGIPTGGTINIIGGDAGGGGGTTRSGDGGGSFYGTGGGGEGFSTTASAGQSYGSGGAGGLSTSGTGRVGANGAAGVIMIMEFK
jgi:hypothetical protein